MGYFDKTISLPMPPLPVPQRLRLWDAGGGALVLAWERPLGQYDGFLILGGPAPDALAPVERLSGGHKAALHWAVRPDTGPCYAVACWRGDAVGEASASVGEWESGRVGDSRFEMRDTAYPTEQARLDNLQSPNLLIPAHLCFCCTSVHALIPGDGALVCPFTGELYAVLNTGELLRATTLPYGLCRCCETRQPLIRCGEELVCYANPTQAYQLVGTHYEPVASGQHTALADAEAIDAALRANSALLGTNGLFIRREE
jgi:hypothetical protein